MSSRSTGPLRRRDSLLAALELYESLELPRSFSSIIMFLYVCENEGLMVSELADIAQVRVAVAARLVKILSGDVPSVPVRDDARLLVSRPSPADRRLRFIYLTEHGHRVRDRLDELIAQASPIKVIAREEPDERGDVRPLLLQSAHG